MLKADRMKRLGLVKRVNLAFFVLLMSGGIASAEMVCEDLALQPYGGAIIASAELIPADSINSAYCKVFATAGAQTDIEVRLPIVWENRLLHIGGGGFDGTIPVLDNYTQQLNQGYVLTGSNGGHNADEYPGGSFGLDPELTQDYAYTAIGSTIRVAKALTNAFYGARPQFTYWNGCSNGGRGAFNALAKYGYEYDGIIAGAPTLNLSGVISGWVGNLSANILSPAKIETIFNAELAQCDGLDGLEDGIISNPDVCSFDPTSIACEEGINDLCLTEEEIAVVNRILSDIELADGKTVYSKFGYGPLTWSGVYGFLGVGHMADIVYRDAIYDGSSFNLDDEYPTIVEVIETAYDFSADLAPLAHYLRLGKKMIVWHGTDDTLLSHYDTIRTYGNVMSAAGGKGRKNAKLYLAPGVGHCSGGNGADTFDFITPITDWVEEGKKPKTIIASKFDQMGSLQFTRPMCEHPKYPRYIGHGDPDDADNFVCKKESQKGKN